MACQIYCLLLTVLLCGKVSTGSNDCRKIVDLKETILAVENVMLNTSCVISRQGLQLTTIIFNRTDTRSESTGELNDIAWSCITTDGNKHGFNISIFPTVSNNGSTIQCSITTNCRTVEATLVVVRGPPPAPHSLVVNSINNTALNLSWSSPWLYPVNNYSITVDTSTAINGGSSYSIVASSTNVILIEEDSTEKCNPINVTVIANTDIGPSLPSIEYMTGFPKNFTNVNVSEFEISINRILCGALDRTYQVSFQHPAVCDYDRLLYTVTVISSSLGTLINETTVLDTPFISYTLPSSPAVAMDTYEINIAVTNSLNETLNYPQTTKLINYKNIATVDSNINVVLSPKSTVAVVNETVSFTCIAFGIDTSFHLIINGNNFVTLSGSNRSGIVTNTDVFYEYTRDGSKDNVTATINATFAKNGTSFVCFFGSNCGLSDTAYLYVAPEGPPPAPHSLVVSSINSTALNLSWSSPWLYPVNDYSITVDTINGGSSYSIVASSTNVILIEEDSTEECNPINVTVIANTDIGPSLPSIEYMTGFPKTLSNVSFKESHLWETTAVDHVIITITVEAQNVCEYEKLIYSFEVINEETGSKWRTDTGPHLNVTIDITERFPGEEDNVFSFLLIVNGTADRTRTIYLITNTSTSASSSSNDLTSSPVISLSITPSLIISTSSIRIIQSSAAAKGPSTIDMQYVIYVSAGGGALLAAILVLICLTCCLCYCYVKRKKNIEITVTLPPRMESNPTYASQNECQYETIANLVELTPLRSKQVSPVPTVGGVNVPPTDFNHAPVLPPPRSMVVPVPWVQGGEGNWGPPQPLQVGNGGVEQREDEYVEMSTSRTHPSPRYIPAPFNALNASSERHRLETVNETEVPSPSTGVWRNGSSSHLHYPVNGFRFDASNGTTV